MDDKAQISLEMILVIAAVLAVAVLLFTQLQSASKTASSKLNSESGAAISKISNITKK